MMQCKFEYLNKTQLVSGTVTSTRLDCDPVTVSMGNMSKFIVIKGLLCKNVTTLIADNYKMVLKSQIYSFIFLAIIFYKLLCIYSALMALALRFFQMV